MFAFERLDKEFAYVLDDPELLEPRLAELKKDRKFNSALGTACGCAFFLGFLAVSLIEYSGKRATLYPLILLGFMSMLHLVRAALLNSEYRVLLLHSKSEKRAKNI
ncbi:MAG: hypothetical protein EOP83_30980 [Verrucomicrobiaceae bacterium]|nr:MAG: hypothetical protein EOP83_30980 [Verrucomicrobiaceae bacterium]